MARKIKRKKTLRQHVLFSIGDSDKDWIAILHDPLQRALCFFQGHVPERDQCMRPEHDFCLWCKKSMPNTWKKP